MQKDQRIPSPQQQLDSSLGDSHPNRTKISQSTPSKRNHASSTNYSPNKSLSEKESNNSHNSSNIPVEKASAFNRSSSSVGGGGATPSKDESANEEITFRRQHFDRNSILRTSKKRSRKASVTSTTAGSSTPGKNTDPNSNTSVNDQNKTATPKTSTSKNEVSQQQQWLDKSLESNNTSCITNNTSLNTTIASEENKIPRVYIEKKSNPAKEVNALYRENVKNLENKTSLASVIGGQKYISKKRDDYNEINEKAYGPDNYRDKQGEPRSYMVKEESNESSKNIRNSNTKQESNFKNHRSSNIMHGYGQNNAGYEYKIDETNKEVKSSTFSASDNVAALLGKDNSKQKFVSNNLTKPISQQKHFVDANITKSRNAIKSNGIKENTATSGASVIRTRREAMRQAEEEIAKSSGRTTRRQHSNNRNDNNGGITTPSKKNEKQDRITQEEDCGRLI